MTDLILPASLTRRTLLKSAAAASVALTAPALLFGQDPTKGGKRYRTALIGCGWWGGNIVREAIASGQCQIVALCDADLRQVERLKGEQKELTADSPKVYQDFRELIDKEKPEIVIVATPDHWHPLITIAAVNAGADVYVEKPVGHTILEGRAMVKAARDTSRMVQVGTHRRVSPHNLSGRDFIRSGKAGKIGMVRAFVHYPGDKEDPEANKPVPKELDWDLWCGPAPQRSYNSKIHAKGFRNFLDYANGTLGDWGIHWMDQILWVMDETAPKKVFSAGGRSIKGPAVNTKTEQTTDAPDHQVASFEFDNFTACWEHRQFAGNNAEKGESVGCYFYGTKGTFHMGWQKGWTFYPVGGEPIHEDPQLHMPDEQNIKELFADFLASVKSRKLPVSDIEIGHRSTTMSLLGMLSLKLGRSLAWDAKQERVIGDDEANKHLKRDYRGDWKYPV
ncbi:MAG TPA: Gfo/Idh/MocA family oxidoreductase, partial [Schlesneria sp.]